MADTTCRYCKAAMPEGARYCAACEHHQGRWAQFWAQLKVQDVLAVMSVGALGVTSIVGGTLNANVLNPHPDIKASLVACRAGAVELAIANIGNRAAFIRSGSAQVKLEGIVDAVGTRKLVAAEPLLLKAGETKPLTLRLDPEFVPYATAENQEHCRLHLTFNWVEPGQGDRPVRAECSCPEG
jgi:hypothetical protein